MIKITGGNDLSLRKCLETKVDIFHMQESDGRVMTVGS
jgi:hypothetical protein